MSQSVLLDGTPFRTCALQHWRNPIMYTECKKEIQINSRIGPLIRTSQIILEIVLLYKTL